jgi:hypothetical protein
LEFEEIKNVNIETIGSLSQITRPCPIKYKSMKAQHQQVQQDRRQTLTEFLKDGKLKLNFFKLYDLTHMAVTSDNKLLNCMDFSPGRVTTALSVHGTTVIPQGRLVNDISPL